MPSIVGTAITSAMILFLFAAKSEAQRAVDVDTRHVDFDAALGFEAESDGSLPTPWWVGSGRQGPTVEVLTAAASLDRNIYRSGQSALRFASVEDGPVDLRLRIPIDFDASTVEIRGYIRTENTLMRRVPFLIDDTGPIGPFPIEEVETGPSWVEFSVMGTPDPRAHTLEMRMSQFPGDETIWLDDLQVLIDGSPLRDAPRVARNPSEREREKLIADALSAGYPAITREATIKTVYGLDIKILREGSNGWTCWAETLGAGPGPMCNQPGWDAWLMAYWNNDDTFEVDRFSTSYMYGEGDAPHVMILVPNPETLDGISTNSRDSIWAMWKDTPYAHIMLFVGDIEQESPLFPEP